MGRCDRGGNTGNPSAWMTALGWEVDVKLNYKLRRTCRTSLKQVSLTLAIFIRTSVPMIRLLPRLSTVSRSHSKKNI